jgi:hypothetical protein
VWRVVHSATGVDVPHAASSWVQGTFSGGSGKAATASFTCTYDHSVQCKARRSSLARETGRYVLVAVATVSALRVVRLGPLAGFASTVFMLAFWPVVAKRTYGLEYGCSLSLTPVLPVCLVSDVQDVVYWLFPPQLPWPSPLVAAGQRPALNASAVASCSELGFGDGVLEIVYWLDRYVPEWRTEIASSATLSWLGFDAQRELQYHTGKQGQGALYEQCAVLFSFTALPVLLALALVALLLYAVLHIAVVWLTFVTKSMGDFAVAAASAHEDGKEAEEA